MYMLADGNFLTKLVCENTDCLSFIISFLDILTVLFLAYCASFRVTKGVRIVGWVWAAVVIAGTVTVVALHTCMFTIISALFTALVLMALFGVTFESMGKKKEEEQPATQEKEEKPAMPFVCPMATWQCAMAAQAPVAAQKEAETVPEEAKPVEEKKAQEVAATTAEEAPWQPAKEEPKAAPVVEVVADSTEGLTLKESLAMAKAVTSAPAVINKKYIADYLAETFGKKVGISMRANYTKTGLPLADTHYALRADGKTCFVYVYETDAAVVLLLRITDQYAKSIQDGGHRINKSAFPKSKDAWYSLVVDDSYSETDIREILADAYAMAK